MSKIQNLQKELNRSTGKIPQQEAAALIVAAPPAVASGRPQSRVGQFNLSSWQPMAFKSSLRLVQARRGNVTIQELMAEALNDLFTKYDVPTVNQD